MPLFRYYLSANVTDPSPPLESMAVVEADTVDEAAKRLIRAGPGAFAPETRWIHFLADIDDRGQPRGFRSIPIDSIDAVQP